MSSPLIRINGVPRESDGWLTRERLLALLLLVATAAALSLCLMLILPFLPSLAWALALSVVAAPVHRAIAARVQNPGVAASITVSLVALGVVAPVVVVSRQLAIEASRFLQYFEGDQVTQQWNQIVENNPNMAPTLTWFADNVDFASGLQQMAKAAAPGVQSIVTGSTWVAFQFLIMLFVLYYVFRDHDAIRRGLRALVPLSEKECDDVGYRVADTIHATLYGSVVVAMVQGTMGGLMFWFLGLATPLVWGVIMGLLALVPYLGTFVVWGPVALFLALNGQQGKAMILVAWGGIAIALVDNLLYPLLVGKRLRLHPLPVFFATVGGVGFFGAAGLVLGPVILAVTMAILEIWRRRTAHGLPGETVVGVSAEPELVAQAR